MTALAPGIFLFESGKTGPRRLYSAGIHGDEIEGIRLLNLVRKLLESRQANVLIGSVMLVFANLAAIENNVRLTKGGRDFNRSFHLDCDPRINEIKKYVCDFKPTIHRDFHCTIKKIDSPFALCSRAKSNYQDSFNPFCNRFGISTIVRFCYGQNKILTTFAGYTVQNFCTESFTIEIGSKNCAETNERVSYFAKSIIDEIQMAPLQSNSLPLNIWNMGKKITKKSENFHFLRQYKNFELLEEGVVYARDANIEYRAGANTGILFPNDDVDIGDRAGVLITYELTNSSGCAFG